MVTMNNVYAMSICKQLMHLYLIFIINMGNNLRRGQGACSREIVQWC